MFRHAIPQLVRRALARQTPDADLLARFVAGQDSDAFTELAERYAPLVWGACRRVLADEHRAEHAFQQTFISLARKAKGLLEEMLARFPKVEAYGDVSRMRTNFLNSIKRMNVRLAA